ncbi:MAG: molybdopterin-dependent oxidoreductase [Nocardioides sp.]|uniref:molybdopterin-dependent oxidoreductase n=1 Tax=Nocardioides sp. TaxID=35761 RepID=UPI003F00EC9A
MIGLRTWASAAGLVAGAAALATSDTAAMLVTIREAPISSVVSSSTGLIPQGARDHFLAILGGADGAVLGTVIVVAYAACSAWAGRARSRAWWRPLLVWLPVWAVLAAGVALREEPRVLELVPVGVGLLTAVLVLELLHLFLRRAESAAEAGTEPGPNAAPETEPEAAAESDAAAEPATTRRGFLVASGVVLLASAAATGTGRVLGRARRHVAESRLLVRLEGLTRGRVPARATLGLVDVAPWQTPTDDFFVFHRAFSPPTVEPDEWRLRIHGLVAREVTLDYDTLVARRLSESWTTLVCVRNEVGGDMVGNAWWSGVLTADLLREAGVDPSADCVVQTGADGWTCVTPLAALTDDRKAMLAVGMNGRPLTIEHGFPVRTVVPGLFGYVSATKWVTDIEVTTYDSVVSEAVEDGWALHGPVRTASRIDVPARGAEVPEGRTAVGGVAWSPESGIERVEVSLDGGPWEVATLGETVGPQAWVQWRHEFDVVAGGHLVVVRATDAQGVIQTSIERDVQPDGATGWHSVEFEAVRPEG